MASLLVHVLLVFLLLRCPLRDGTPGYSVLVLLGRLRDGTAALHSLFVISVLSQARVSNVSPKMYRRSWVSSARPAL